MTYQNSSFLRARFDALLGMAFFMAWDYLMFEDMHDARSWAYDQVSSLSEDELVEWWDMLEGGCTLDYSGSDGDFNICLR